MGSRNSNILSPHGLVYHDICHFFTSEWWLHGKQRDTGFLCKCGLPSCSADLRKHKGVQLTVPYYQPNDWCRELNECVKWHLWKKKTTLQLRLCEAVWKLYLVHLITDGPFICASHHLAEQSLWCTCSCEAVLRARLKMCFISWSGTCLLPRLQVSFLDRMGPVPPHWTFPAWRDRACGSHQHQHQLAQWDLSGLCGTVERGWDVEGKGWYGSCTMPDVNLQVIANIVVLCASLW